MTSRADELQALVNDLRFLDDEKVAIEHELREARSQANDLLRANHELSERLEKVTVERDKMQAFAINLYTRLQVIGENVANVIQEAARGAISQAGRLQEQRRESVRQEPPRAAAIPIRPVHTVPPQIAPEPPQPRQVRQVDPPLVEDEDNLRDLVERLGTKMPPVTFP